MSNDNVTLNAHPCPTEKQRVTARQVAESLSVRELREAAKEFRVKPEEASVEDIAALLEYIADLRDEPANAKFADELLEALERFVEGGYGGTKGNVCMWCGSETREFHNRVCRLGNAEAVIRKANGGQQ